MNIQPLNFEMVPMQLEDIHQVSKNELSAHEFPWTENNFLDSISSGYWAYVLKTKNPAGDEDFVGHCVFMPGVDEIHLLNITVLPIYRRHQIANRALRTIEPIAKKASMQKCLLEVRVSNLPAISLYKQLGYHEIARRKDYYRAGFDVNGVLLKEDAIIMVKELI